jgi:hypothetical protein
MAGDSKMNAFAEFVFVMWLLLMAPFLAGAADLLLAPQVRTVYSLRQQIRTDFRETFKSGTGEHENPALASLR